MNKKTIKLSLWVLTLSVALFIPGFAFGDEVEGSVQGFMCVTQGKICPVGREDPMAAVENVFVVLTTGKDYYFVPNMDRAVLARHINDRVRVTGTLSNKYPAITAKTLDVYSDGRWRMTWELDYEKQLQESLSNAEN